MAPLNRLTFFARAARARAVAGRRVFNQAPRRHYASEGGHAAPGSDIPWMAGGAAITIGGVYLLWPPSNGGHGGDHGHGDSHGAAKEEESKEEEAPAEESKDEDKEEASKGDDSGDDKQEDKKDEGDDKKEDKEDKEDDSKHDSKDDGKGDSKDKGGDDKRTAYEKYDGKPKGGRENTSSKEGPENTLARHASSPHSHAEKSKKSEGTVDTARIKGTIDPKREQK